MDSGRGACALKGVLGKEDEMGTADIGDNDVLWSKVAANAEAGGLDRRRFSRSNDIAV